MVTIPDGIPDEIYKELDKKMKSGRSLLEAIGGTFSRCLHLRFFRHYILKQQVNDLKRRKKPPNGLGGFLLAEQAHRFSFPHLLQVFSLMGLPLYALLLSVDHFGFQARRRRALVTTKMLLQLMAAAAISGVSVMPRGVRAPAATGMQITL